MRKFCTLVLLFTFVFLLVGTNADAQRFTLRKRYASVGVHLGAMNYFGDIVPEPDFTSLRFKSTRPNIGISYTYRYFPRISVRGSLHWGRIIGDDAKSASQNESENLGRFKRNLSFRNDIKELSVVAIVDLFENRQTYRRRPDFVPYGFVGVAVFHHNPKAYYESGSHPDLGANDIPTGWYELQPLGTEGQHVDGQGYPEPYKRVQVAVPFGLGMRYKLDRYWDLSFEVGWRKTFTDYLDDASSAFVNKADLLGSGNGSPNRQASAIFSDRSAEGGFATVADPSPGVPYKRVEGFGTPANQRRGDKTDKDWYIVSGVNINYILTPRIRSPKFR